MDQVPYSLAWPDMEEEREEGGIARGAGMGSRYLLQEGGVGWVVRDKELGFRHVEFEAPTRQLVDDIS